ncbi:MAG: acetyl-CoA carboxylase biotin carboxylase subunit [Sandaracinaceae bacterium]|nr:acetyl-CoA carboxylase biotin carboxylase subunit [Sandaracinaceae bacterium]
MLKKVLIANRGEIAVRVIRACRELGIEAVAVHSTVDAEALHVRLADRAVCIGPAPSAQSYLNVPAIIAAAEIAGADAIHPGYGFLSENAEFADICEQCGLTFIGPTPRDMQQWGEKVPARRLATSLGLPLLPGTAVLADADDAVRQAENIGYPVILKASAGGGGRGMKIVRSAPELRRVFPQAQSEAIAGFRNGDLYLERFVEEPRHIEFQVIADGQGNARVLGERECSIQRRHQKLLEEAPSVAMSQELRGDMIATLERAMKESGYRSAGTLEFLLDERENLYFMEMNTRIQVEHPVTEEVSGVDLILEQIRIASGEGLSIPKDRPIVLNGHAIECRINAEDPETFAPWPGRITEYHPAGGAGVRVDAGIYGGWRVPSAYDSLLLKLITHGRSRSEAIRKMERALRETLIGGIRTNVPLHLEIMRNADFRDGRLSTKFLERLRGSRAA